MPLTRLGLHAGAASSHATQCLPVFQTWLSELETQVNPGLLSGIGQAWRARSRRTPRSAALPRRSSPDWQGQARESVHSSEVGRWARDTCTAGIASSLRDTATHPTRRLSPPMPNTCFDRLSLSLFERERLLGETGGPFVCADPLFERLPSPAFVCQLGFSNAPPPATISDGPDPSDPTTAVFCLVCPCHAPGARHGSAAAWHWN